MCSCWDRRLALDDPVLGARPPLCPSIIQSGRRQLLLLDLPRTIRSAVSGLIGPDDAIVMLWLLSLVLLRMIQSRALHGLVTASLHHHTLVRVSASLQHQWLLPLAASLLPHSLVLLAGASFQHGLVHMSASLLHHGLVLIIDSLNLLGFVLISASLHHHALVLMAAFLQQRGLIHRSASLLHHIPASTLLHCIFSDSS